MRTGGQGEQVDAVKADGRQRDSKVHVELQLVMVAEGRPGAKRHGNSIGHYVE